MEIATYLSRDLPESLLSTVWVPLSPGAHSDRPSTLPLVGGEKVSKENLELSENWSLSAEQFKINDLVVFPQTVWSWCLDSDVGQNIRTLVAKMGMFWGFFRWDLWMKNEKKSLYCILNYSAFRTILNVELCCNISSCKWSQRLKRGSQKCKWTYSDTKDSNTWLHRCVLLIWVIVVKPEASAQGSNFIAPSLHTPACNQGFYCCFHAISQPSPRLGPSSLHLHALWFIFNLEADMKHREDHLPGKQMIWAHSATTRRPY